MPLITDWIMVVCTIVYVVATIFICWANLKSAKASKEELKELRREFEYENRPRIEVEFWFDNRTWYNVRFVNHGRKTAQDVIIELDGEFIDSLSEQEFKDALLKQKGKKCIVGVGQHYDLCIGSFNLRNNTNIKPVTGRLSYKDENETYESEIYIDIKSYATFFSSQNDEEKMTSEIKKVKSELEGIKNAIINLTN